MPTRITGWGHALPPTILDNSELESRLDTSDTWIMERTGIRERHVGGTTSDLAYQAGLQAIGRAGVKAAGIDLLVLATTTPDLAMPAASTSVHHRLGLSGGALDLNAACSGFVYAFVLADSLLEHNSAGIKRLLLIGADTLAGITDPADRTTAVLFGDGAGALVLEAASGSSGGSRSDRTGSRSRESGEGLGRPVGAGGLGGAISGESGDGYPQHGLLGADLGNDGSGYSLLTAAHGGYIEMEGREIFRRAVRVTVESAQVALARAHLTAEDVSLFVPHQANLRIIQAACERLGIDEKRTAITIDRTGNTSAASIPLALSEALDTGRVREGDIVLMTGFGAGMSWGSVVVRI